MEDFLFAWSLFHDAWLVALLLAMVLPLCGIVLVLRHQMFLGAAIGQAATLGIAIGIWLGLAPAVAASSSHSETFALLLAAGAGSLTAVVAMRALSTTGSQLEARSVWVFLGGASLSVLLTSKQPHGLEEVQRLTLSSLLGASPFDVWFAAGLLVATLLAVCRWRRGILLWAIDPVTTQVHGGSLLVYDLAVGIGVGVATGFAIHSTGLLFAFGLTVLPVLLARSVARSLAAMLWLAPLLGSLVTAAALVLAHVGDLPPGQVAVGGLVLLLAVPALLGGILRRATAVAMQ
ncbi:MAG TPA: metal ABC transporter permease [Planctomycetota bacterium]|nr:metal ABC transporter permease [Planctomycetota bacterium]